MSVADSKVMALPPSDDSDSHGANRTHVDQVTAAFAATVI